MIIDKPCDWIIDRLKARRPFFAVRLNDGEFSLMFRSRKEGEEIGTAENKVHVRYEEGDALRYMCEEMATHIDPEDNGILVGSSWWHDSEHEDTQKFRKWAEHHSILDGGWKWSVPLKEWNWCHEHWPLEGVRDGSTQRMLAAIRYKGENSVLVTCEHLMNARRCFGGGGIVSPQHNSWQAREDVYRSCIPLAQLGRTFVWAAGCGLKPTAWQLFKEFPQSSHIDVGHLFNGAFGLRDYGWLQRQDGPWYEPYFRKDGFADWVRSFVK